MKTTKKTSIVHRYFILLKLHYFFYFASFGSLYPILNIFLRGRGLSDGELSVINLIIPFLLFFSNPFAGFISDHTKRYLLTFNVFLIIANVIFSGLFALTPMSMAEKRLPIVGLDSKYSVCLNENDFSGCQSEKNCSFVVRCEKNSPFEISSSNFSNGLVRQDEADCSTKFVLPIDDSRKSSMENVFCEFFCSKIEFCPKIRINDQLKKILIYALLYIIGNNFYMNAITLGVSLGFASLDDSNRFGEERLWGTIGFGVAMYLAGFVQKIFKTDVIYIILFVIFSGLCVLVTSFIRIKPIPKEKQPENEEKKKSKTLIFELIPILKKLDTIIFLLLAFLWGTSYSNLDPYLYLYVDELEPNNSRQILPYMGMVAAVSEVLAFFFSAKIFEKLGTELCSILIFIAFAIRLCGYYFIPKAIFFTIVETMHFFNFGIYYVFIVKEANILAPAGLSGTLQALGLGISLGLGRGAGLIVAAFIIQYYHTKYLFLLFGIFNFVCAAAFTIFFVFRRILASKKSKKDVQKKNSQLKDDPNEEPLLEKAASAPH